MDGSEKIVFAGLYSASAETRKKTGRVVNNLVDLDYLCSLSNRAIFTSKDFRSIRGTRTCLQFTKRLKHQETFPWIKLEITLNELCYILSFCSYIIPVCLNFYRWFNSGLVQVNAKYLSQAVTIRICYIRDLLNVLLARGLGNKVVTESCIKFSAQKTSLFPVATEYSWE